MAQSPTKTTPRAPEPEALNFGKTYIFRLRQHDKGNFSGLWELSLLNDKHTVTKILADADALTYCFENLQGELENDGF